MAHARLHDEPLSELNDELFEQQRLKKLELAITILASLVVLALLAAHFVGQGMPNPAVY